MTISLKLHTDRSLTSVHSLQRYYHGAFSQDSSLHDRFRQHSDYVTDVAWISRVGKRHIAGDKNVQPSDVLYSVSTDKSLIENIINCDKYN